MATTFLEPGGDADIQAVNTAGVNTFWSNQGGAIAPVTDFVHGGHIRSLKYRPNNQDQAATPVDSFVDTGGRISFYFYMVTKPAVTNPIFITQDAIFSKVINRLKVTTAGVLQLFETTAQIGSNGSTLNTGQWYRISLAMTITSTTVNRFEVFVDGVSDISVTNATLTNTGTSRVKLGNTSTDTALDFRGSDFYVDNSSSLTDTGDIWVTAKRPFSNGTANNFTTQIGSGNSGYGSGHADEVNERALSTTNGWSIQSASKQTEEYTIEAASAGDIDITGATIVDYMGWVSTKVGSASTGNIIVGGTATNISVTTTATVFTKIKGSTTYPAGNTDIGMDTNTVNQLFSLYECGIIIAYIPTTASSSPSTSPSSSPSTSVSSSPSSSPSPSSSVSSSISSSPSASVSNSPSTSPSSSPSPSSSVSDSTSSSPSSSPSPSSSVSSSPSTSPSSSPSPSSSVSDSPSSSPSSSPSPSSSVSNSPSSSPSTSVSDSPSTSPSSSPSPSSSVSNSPSTSPSSSPSPSSSVSSSPSTSPSTSVSNSPSSSPSSSPSPSSSVSNSPSSSDSSSPSPSSSVSNSPSTSPSSSPSPSSSISNSPSSSVSNSPSTSVSSSPSSSASSSPSTSPSTSPSAVSGRLNYWTGSNWVVKPLKYWNGSAWVEKTVKWWDGTWNS